MTSSLPSFAIVIPSYNYARYLPRAIASATGQQVLPQQVIVVDDGSTDDTPRVLAQYASHPLVHCIRQANAGVSVARNTGAEAARADWLVFFDADDELLPAAIGSFATAASAHPDAGMVISHHFSVGTDGHARESQLKPTLGEPAQNFRAFLNRDWGIVHGSVAMRRDVWDRLRYPPGITNGEDLVLFGQALACYPAVSIPVPTARIYDHSGRARDNAAAIRATGLTTVERLFNPAIMPPELMRLKHQFRYRRLLSLGRSMGRAGHDADAWQAYREVLFNAPHLLLDPTHAGRALRSFWNRKSPPPADDRAAT